MTDCLRLGETIEAGLIDAVRQAARREIMPRFRRLEPNHIATKSGPDDFVTDADVRAERIIAEAARTLLPDALILGEEAVHANPALLDRLATADQAVIIDPVDGTANYAAGLSLFGVIVAVIIEGRTAFGLLYDPVMDDWVLARRGGGAWFCRPYDTPRRLQNAKAKPIEDCLGYVPLHLFPKHEQAGIASAFPKFKRITSLRCSCHEYRMMAFGHADFIFAPSPKPWDHAAGTLVVEECGGRAETETSEVYAPGTPAHRLFTFISPEAKRAHGLFV